MLPVPAAPRAIFYATSALANVSSRAEGQLALVRCEAVRPLRLLLAPPVGPEASARGPKATPLRTARAAARALANGTMLIARGAENATIDAADRAAVLAQYEGVVPLIAGLLSAAAWYLPASMNCIGMSQKYSSIFGVRTSLRDPWPLMPYAPAPQEYTAPLSVMT